MIRKYIFLVMGVIASCSDIRDKSNDPEIIYKGTQVGENARSETDVKTSPEDREWWGTVNNIEIVNAVFDAVYSGKITPYDFMGNKISIDDVKNMEYSVDTMYVENFETGELEEKIVENKLNRDEIIKFFFKENWYFDKENFNVTKEVKAITMLTDKYNEKGELIGQGPLFTVYFDKKYEPDVVQ